MSAERDAKSAETYLNPVHPRDFPDPFVLKFAGEYFAYCTGFWRDGRAFGVMRSRDLVRWEELAGAMEPLPGGHPCYWAPEVFYRNGKFLMYYSVGDEKLMHIRVAVADRPEGPFADSGRQLTTQEFAIDAHVFVDRDGSRYLFYATDFLTHTHIGTGTVVDKMIDDFTLEGRPRPVTRARYDWQVYDPNRKEKGGVRWHTVEGPFVLRRKGLYYEMFSGGNWQNVSYGVSYAVSDQVLKDEEWRQHADGEKVLPILRTIPGEVVGPGHNSVVRGPDNQQLFCVYHRWAEEGRVLAVDRMEFVGDALAVIGPTTTPQPAPTPPWFADNFDDPHDDGLGEGWECVSGRWSVRDGEARQEAARGAAEARCRVESLSFVAEVWLRSLGESGTYGVCVGGENSTQLRFVIDATQRRATLSPRTPDGFSDGEPLELPEDFDPRDSHLLRVEIDGDYSRFTLDGLDTTFRGGIGFEDNSSARRLSLYCEGAQAAFKGFALTRGFEDDFYRNRLSLARPWVETGKVGGVPLKLWAGGAIGRAYDELASGSFELVMNLKTEGGSAEGGGRGYVITPGSADGSGPPARFELARAGGGGWALLYRCAGAEKSFALPGGFEPWEFQQFRFRREGGRLTALVGGTFVCDVRSGAGGEISIAAGASPVLPDMVRMTAIKSS